MHQFLVSINKRSSYSQISVFIRYTKNKSCAGLKDFFKLLQVKTDVLKLIYLNPFFRYNSVEIFHECRIFWVWS